MDTENQELDQEIDQEITNEESNPLESLKNGDVSFFDLPYDERQKLKSEIKKSLPDDAKEAMDLGWTPKEMFRGKYKDGTDKPWDDYGAFLDRVKNEAPVRNERMRSVSSERDTFKDENDSLRKQMKALLEINKSKMDRDILSEEQLTDREMANAKDEYDFDRYDTLRSRKEALQKEKLQLKQFEQPPLPPEDPTLDPDVQAWASENQWIVREPKLLKIAQIKDQELELLEPNLTKRERFNLVSEKMNEQFPDKNPSPKRTFEAPKNSANFGSKPKTKTFQDLPSVEQKQADILIKQGVWKDRADFIKTYSW
tara:strand:+ start:470 stop:1405 length:936 start_codon:yes stop_codon:yes gene_type:complete